MSPRSDPEKLIARWRSGDETARNQLVELLHANMADIASALLRRAPASIVTDELVSEAVIRLFKMGTIAAADRAHLLALSARAMRHVLIDRARSRLREKRHGLHVTLSEHVADKGAMNFDVLSLDRALVRLKAIDETRATIVEMRYFAGMTLEDIAVATGVSLATVKRQWAGAKVWLRDAIENDID